MAIKSVIGATVSVGTAFETPLTINAITNASQAVATLAATTNLATGNIVKISSAWDRLNDRVAKVSLLGSDRPREPTGCRIRCGRHDGREHRLSVVPAS